MKRPTELFNVLTGVGGLILVIASKYIHGNLGIILFWFAILLLIIAMHFEVLERLNFKHKQFTIPIICLILLIFYLSQSQEEDKTPEIDRARIILDYEKPITTILEVGKLIRISPWCKNTGNTDALNYYHAYWNILSPTLKPTQQLLDSLFYILNAHGKSGLILGAKMSIEMRSELKKSILSEEDYHALFSGLTDLYRMGAIIYYDVSGKQRFTWYCLQFNPKSNIFFTYPKYNGFK